MRALGEAAEQGDVVADAAVEVGLGQREPGADIQLVAHTDRGSQYTSADYIKDHGVLASVGTVGDAYDNPMGRELCRLLQDRADRRPHLALSLPAGAVVEYISWFNNDRLHESLGDVSPLEFESLYVAQGVQLSNLLNWNPTKTVSVEPGLAQVGDPELRSSRGTPGGDRPRADRLVPF